MSLACHGHKTPLTCNGKIFPRHQIAPCTPSKLLTQNEVRSPRTSDDQTLLHSTSHKESGVEKRTSLPINEDLDLWNDVSTQFSLPLSCSTGVSGSLDSGAGTGRVAHLYWRKRNNLHFTLLPPALSAELLRRSLLSE